MSWLQQGLEELASRHPGLPQDPRVGPTWQHLMSGQRASAGQVLYPQSAGRAMVCRLLLTPEYAVAASGAFRAHLGPLLSEALEGGSVPQYAESSGIAGREPEDGKPLEKLPSEGGGHQVDGLGEAVTKRRGAQKGKSQEGLSGPGGRGSAGIGGERNSQGGTQRVEAPTISSKRRSDSGTSGLAPGAPGASSSKRRALGLQLGQGHDGGEGNGHEDRLLGHEAVCRALALVLSVAPGTLRQVEVFFRRSLPPFHCIAATTRIEGGRVLCVAETSLLLLSAAPSFFGPLWDWSPLLRFMHWAPAPETRHTTDEAMQGDEGEGGEGGVSVGGALHGEELVKAVRWTALEVHSAVSGMTSTLKAQLADSLCGLDAVSGFKCFLRWHALRSRIETERARMFLPAIADQANSGAPSGALPGPQQPKAASTVGWSSGAPSGHSLGDSFETGSLQGGGTLGDPQVAVNTRTGCVNVCGVELPLRRRASHGPQSPSSSALLSCGPPGLVLTPTATQNLEALALAVSLRRPVLLDGPAGSGKSALVEFLANTTGNTGVVRIHMDDQMDSKTLLGAYTCTDVPGQFRWQPGVLTQAVRSGLWLVFENIDAAPFELLSSLTPLLEDRCLHLPGWGEVIEASPEFQVFGTRSISQGASRRSQSGVAELLSSLWQQVVVHPPPEEELPLLLSASFPSATPLISPVLATFRRIQELSGARPLRAPAEDGAAHPRPTDGPGPGAGSVLYFGREFSLRDVFKLCSRLQSTLPRLSAAEAAAVHRGAASWDPEAHSAQTRERAFIEAADCLAAMLPNRSERLGVIQELGRIWGVPGPQVEYLHALARPQVHHTSRGLHVGRIFLEASSAGGAADGSADGSPGALSQAAEWPAQGVPAAPRMGFSATGGVARVMEAVAACAASREPVLLVGETGTGKTTVVQHLARLQNRRVTVLNMSQQSDSSDFLGGFKPVDTGAVCLPLLHTFSVLFTTTFPSQNNGEFLVRTHKFGAKKKWVQLLQAFRMALAKVASLSSEDLASEAPNGPGAQQEQERQLQQQQEGDQEDRDGAPRKAGGRGPPQSAKRGAKAAPGGKPKRASGQLDADQREAPSDTPPKRPKKLSDQLSAAWREFAGRLRRAERQVAGADSSFAFAFVEGGLVRALREGHWLLLDEANLAPPETLERLGGVLEGAGGSVALTEKGDIDTVPRHPNFRVFACMNPATDVGKRDLPAALKARFTEIYVDEITAREDLSAIVFQHLEGTVATPPVDDIVDFYLAARQEAQASLFDGANQKPQYNLRTLSRALEYTRTALPLYGFLRSLYDGFSMCFLTLLDRSCMPVMERLIERVLLRSASTPIKALLRAPPCPGNNPSQYVLFEQFWVQRGPNGPEAEDAGGGAAGVPAIAGVPGAGREGFVLTASVKEHLRNLARAVLVRRYPILLQGPTSSGKTSLVEYLAQCTGHTFVRISNHEHTDLQEYLGAYVTSKTGKLVFQEGPLVEAVRKGHWIVLDELNLAPSDVLEALNRLLDDNRELFVPELQETVRPHPQFMLFATQNPPGIYGGRKVLSRAFRSRFLELHVDDIPAEELKTIVEKRCAIAPSYAAKMVEVMKELQRHRQSSAVFAGKHGFITPRDLFRWADRQANGYEALARDGYMLLAERLREDGEKEVVRRTLQRHLRVQLDVGALYTEVERRIADAVASEDVVASLGRIVWTGSMRRMFTLVDRCLGHAEAVLLVGDTGCGKTTACQLAALVRGQQIHILNCHQRTETSDIIGGYRPVRDRHILSDKYSAAVTEAQGILEAAYSGDAAGGVPQLGTNIADAQETASLIRSLVGGSRPAKGLELSGAAAARLEEVAGDMEAWGAQWGALFAWHDGPLVAAMRAGDVLLLDEVSLAEDSVLERLNSVLEPKRTLVLAEKGGSQVEVVRAHPAFRLVATMNPGGDYGKKELSPALRNRFTELWVGPISDPADLLAIVRDRFRDEGKARELAPLMLEFWQWFLHDPWAGKTAGALSVRDLISWVAFLNCAPASMPPGDAYLHGANLVLLDGIGLGQGMAEQDAAALRRQCLDFLKGQIHKAGLAITSAEAAAIPIVHLGVPEQSATASGPPGAEGKAVEGQAVEVGERGINGAGVPDEEEGAFGIAPFFIERGLLSQKGGGGAAFELQAPTTRSNALRVLRAMQLRKPILLEGSPGVGKTSLVSAIAAASGHRVVRINLSEQTDMMDLLGSDLPEEGARAGSFAWADGVFLQALKAGDWVLLDELNLASQSVLEGLNACLDHRAEVFIPELGRAFHCPPSFRILACQNPLHQGGGRKGLPKSFLNRFTKVYVEALGRGDLEHITGSLYPGIPPGLRGRMVEFNERLHHDAAVARSFAHAGGPWEFNLRDILRWGQLCCPAQGASAPLHHPGQFVGLLYWRRMRSPEDRAHVAAVYQDVFQEPLDVDSLAHPQLAVGPSAFSVGAVALLRGAQGDKLTAESDTVTPEGEMGSSDKGGVHSDRRTPEGYLSLGQGGLSLLPHQMGALESLAQCVVHGWMAVLVGPRGCGKTSVLRALARLAGARLHELALTSGTDTTDLLGCFEQFDAGRRLREAEDRVSGLLQSVCDGALLLCSQGTAQVGPESSEAALGGRSSGMPGAVAPPAARQVTDLVCALRGSWAAYQAWKRHRAGPGPEAADEGGLQEEDHAREGLSQPPSGLPQGSGASAGENNKGTIDRGDGGAEGRSAEGEEGDKAGEEKQSLAACAMLKEVVEQVERASRILWAPAADPHPDLGKAEGNSAQGEDTEPGENSSAEAASLGGSASGGALAKQAWVWEALESVRAFLDATAAHFAPPPGPGEAAKGAPGASGKASAGQFEWLDGALVTAMQRGDWVLLDNANLCSPSVLDRLNPLLEPDGVLMVNERGLVGGAPLVVRPHPAFRVFLTLDPQHGEISRAMRNRGVELFMAPLPLGPDQGARKGGVPQASHAEGAAGTAGEGEMGGAMRPGSGEVDGEWDVGVYPSSGADMEEGGWGKYSGGVSGEAGLAGTLYMPPARLVLRLLAYQGDNTGGALLDCQRQLATIGIPGLVLGRALAQAHLHVQRAAAHQGASSRAQGASLRDLRGWVRVLVSLLEGGAPLAQGLQRSWYQTFVRPALDPELRRAAREIGAGLAAYLGLLESNSNIDSNSSSTSSDSDELQAGLMKETDWGAFSGATGPDFARLGGLSVPRGVTLSLPLVMPDGFPFPLPLSVWLRHPIPATLLHHSAVLVTLVAQWRAQESLWEGVHRQLLLLQQQQAGGAEQGQGKGGKQQAKKKRKGQQGAQVQEKELVRDPLLGALGAPEAAWLLPQALLQACMPAAPGDRAGASGTPGQVLDLLKAIGTPGQGLKKQQQEGAEGGQQGEASEAQGWGEWAAAAGHAFLCCAESLPLQEGPLLPVWLQHLASLLCGAHQGPSGAPVSSPPSALFLQALARAHAHPAVAAARQGLRESVLLLLEGLPGAYHGLVPLDFRQSPLHLSRLRDSLAAEPDVSWAHLEASEKGRGQGSVVRGRWGQACAAADSMRVLHLMAMLHAWEAQCLGAFVSSSLSAYTRQGGGAPRDHASLPLLACWGPAVLRQASVLALSCLHQHAAIRLSWPENLHPALGLSALVLAALRNFEAAAAAQLAQAVQSQGSSSMAPTGGEGEERVGSGGGRVGEGSGERDRAQGGVMHGRGFSDDTEPSALHGSSLEGQQQFQQQQKALARALEAEVEWHRALVALLCQEGGEVDMGLVRFVWGRLKRALVRLGHALGISSWPSGTWWGNAAPGLDVPALLSSLCSETPASNTQEMDVGASWEDLHAAIWRMDHALGTPAPWGASGTPEGFPSGARGSGVPGGYPGGGGAELYLWKHGGHPQMHRSLRLCQLDLEISRLCDSLPHGGLQAGSSRQLGAVAGEGALGGGGLEREGASRCAAGPQLRLRAVEALAVLRQGAASVAARARAEGTGRESKQAGGAGKGVGGMRGAEKEAQGGAGVKRAMKSVEEAGEEILEMLRQECRWATSGTPEGEPQAQDADGTGQPDAGTRFEWELIPPASLPPGSSGVPVARGGHHGGSKPGAPFVGAAPGAPGAWLEARLAQGPLCSPLLARWPELARLWGALTPLVHVCAWKAGTPLVRQLGRLSVLAAVPGGVSLGAQGSVGGEALGVGVSGIEAELRRLAPLGEEVEGVIRFNAAAAAGPLSLLCGHQLLLWLLEAHGTPSTVTVGASAAGGEGRGGQRADRGLQEFLGAMLHAVVLQQAQGAVPQPDAIGVPRFLLAGTRGAPGGPLVPGAGAGAGGGGGTEGDMSPKTAAGLLLNPLSLLAFDLTATGSPLLSHLAASGVPVAFHAAHLEQLGAAAYCLSWDQCRTQTTPLPAGHEGHTTASGSDTGAGYAGDTLWEEVQVAGASLCQAVAAHSKHLGPEQQQSLVGALVGFCAAFAAPSSVKSSASAGTDGDSDSAVEALMESLRELDLPRISAYHDTLVCPALTALTAASSAACLSAAAPRPTSADVHRPDTMTEGLVHQRTLGIGRVGLLVHLGTAQLLVGALRLHLLIPQDGCDPAARHAAKSWHLRALLQDLSLQRDVRAACEMHLRGSGRFAACRGLTERWGELSSGLRRTEARGCTRVSPADWWPLFSEVSAFLQATGSLQRTLGLVTEAEAAWGHGQAGGAPAEGPSGGLGASSPLEACSAKLLSWQGVVVEFAHRLARRFPGYADIVHPVQLACFQMARGAQLLAAGMEAQAASHTSLAWEPFSPLEHQATAGGLHANTGGVAAGDATVASGRPGHGSSGVLSQSPGAVAQAALVPLLQFPRGPHTQDLAAVEGQGQAGYTGAGGGRREYVVAPAGVLSPEVAEAALLVAEPLLGALDMVQKGGGGRGGVSANVSLSASVGVEGEMVGESGGGESRGEMVSVVKVLLLRAALLRVADSRHAQLLQDIQRNPNAALSLPASQQRHNAAHKSKKSQGPALDMADGLGGSSTPEAILALQQRDPAELRVLGKAFASFAALWAEMRDWEAERAREEGELFRNKAVETSLSSAAEEEEKGTEDDLAALFPSHAEVYQDLADQGGLASAEEDDRRAEQREKEQGEGAGAGGAGGAPGAGRVPAAWRMLKERGADGGACLTTELVRLHCLLFAGPATVTSSLLDGDGGPLGGASQKQKLLRSRGQKGQGGAQEAAAQGSLMRSFTAAYHAATFLVKAQEGLMAPGCDDALRNAHVLRISSVARALQLPAHSLLSNSSASSDAQDSAASSGGGVESAGGEFDIHRDACPGELAKMLPLLKELLARLGALLEEWPDHPALALLLQICQRLCGLPMGTPLMRAVTGLELLLAKAQGWQETAASHVSLGAQLNPVASLVKRWRTMELSNWPRLLASCARQHEASAENLWFSLYNMVHRPMDPASVKDQLRETAEGLQEFVASAPAGEFAQRLRMLRAFAGELAVRRTAGVPLQRLQEGKGQEGEDSGGAEGEKGGGQKGEGHEGYVERRVGAILHNLCEFYAQFAPIVGALLARQKAPLEKELRDAVRLAKWDDRNVYSLAAAVERSRRKLVKVRRKWDEVLRQPAMAAVRAHLEAQASSAHLSSLLGPASETLPPLNDIKQEPEGGAPAAGTLSDPSQSVKQEPEELPEGLPGTASETLPGAAEQGGVQEGPPVPRIPRFRAFVEAALAEVGTRPAGAPTRKGETPAEAPGEGASGAPLSRYADRMGQLSLRAASLLASAIAAPQGVSQLHASSTQAEAAGQPAPGVPPTEGPVVGPASWTAWQVDSLKETVVGRAAELRRIGEEWAEEDRKAKEEEEGEDEKGIEQEGKGKGKGKEKKKGKGKGSKGRSGDRQGMVRAMKKKALVDLLRALRAAGLSHFGSAVPEDFAKAGGWMYVDPASVGALLAHIPALFPTQPTLTSAPHASIAAAVPSSPCGSSPGMPQLGLWEAAAGAHAQWGRSQGLFFRALSRAAQMHEAAGEYHKDLTKREVDLGAGMVHHLLFVQSQQQGAAHGMAAQLAHLAHLVSLLGTLGGSHSKDAAGAQPPPAPVPPQECLKRHFAAVQAHVAALRTSCSDLLLFVSSANGTPVGHAWREQGAPDVAHAAAALQEALQAISNCQAEMDAVLFQSGCCDTLPLASTPGAPPAFAHPAKASTLTSVLDVMGATHRKLRARLTWDAPGAPLPVGGVLFPSSEEGSGSVEGAQPWCFPGWATVEAHFAGLSAEGRAFREELGPWLGQERRGGESQASLAPGEGEGAGEAAPFWGVFDGAVEEALKAVQALSKRGQAVSGQKQGPEQGQEQGVDQGAGVTILQGDQQEQEPGQGQADRPQSAGQVDDIPAALTALGDHFRALRLPAVLASLHGLMQQAGELVDKCAAAATERGVSAAATLGEAVSGEGDAQGGEAGAQRQAVVLGQELSLRLRQLYPLAAMLLAAGLTILDRHLRLLHSVCGLSYVLASLLRVLFREGFCGPAVVEDGEAGGGAGGRFEEASGTGMGEGEGKKDVSDQIESEDQLLGTNAEKEDKQQAEEKGKPEGKEERPKGVEMEEDFEGALEDVSEDEEGGEEEEKEREGEEGEGEEERLEQQMGEVGEDAEVVDEKLWSKEDEEEQGEEGRKEAGKEKLEQGAGVSGVDEELLEYRGKEEEEEEGGGKEGEKEEKGKKDKKKEKKEGRPEDPGGEEEAGEGGEEAGGEGEEAKEEEGPVNEDLVEESHGKKPRREEQEGEQEEEEGREGDEFPEDLTMEDAGEKEGEGEGEGAGDEKATEAQEKGEEGDAEGEEGPGEEEAAGEEGGAGDAEGDDKASEEKGEEEGVEDGPGESPEAEAEAGQAPSEAPEDADKGEGGSGGNQVAPEEEEEQEEEGAGEGKEEPPVVGTKGEREAATAPGVKSRDGEDEMAMQSYEQQGEENNETAGGGRAVREEEEDKEEGGQQGAQGGKRVHAEGREAGARERKQREERLKANPFRDMGDALRAWKRRVQLVEEDEGGPEEGQEEQGGGGEGGDEKGREADEYEFAPKGGEEDQDAEQALGPATEEQLAEMRLEKDKEERMEEGGKEEEVGGEQEEAGGGDDGADKEEEVEEEEAGGGAKRSKGGLSRSRDRRSSAAKEDQEMPDADGPRTDAEPKAEGVPAHLDESKLDRTPGGAEEGPDSYASLRLVREAKEAAEVGEGERGISEEDMKVMREGVEAEVRAMRETGGGRARLEAARRAWRRYEALCAGAAGELAEQMRLILEPTHASKLAGDFRSGKRISMRKVIPYIASQFRRDKIWLRRTRPDKRQYQIVLAIDDSRSMAEAQCGALALEALATISKAVTTVEVGELAVVAFGEPGNVKLLHPLDKPFTPEAAVEVVSQFSFAQDNTISDEPVVDLLRFLSSLLHSAAQRVSAASAASGHANLRQLVLIIADGRFHEKESLQRMVRQASSQGQLLAFLVLDSAKDSILDLQSVSFAGGAPVFAKYLDTFPFPFYILLRDVQALPRTLAGLLRQWLELVSNMAQ